MRRQLVAGNWKMHGSLEANSSLLQALVAAAPATCDVAVCVPFPYLAQAQQLLAGSSIALGAQDCSMHEQGAFTGEVSAGMLREFGCGYVIVGHSERRSLHGEGDAAVAAKAERALAAGLIPIVCVGETLQQREQEQTEAVIGLQLDAVAHLLGRHAARIVLAYEPVWAIGSGATPTPDDVQQACSAIRTVLGEVVGPTVAGATRILYGGSVHPDNTADLVAGPDVDGVLVGGASLQAESFAAIAGAAAAAAVAASGRRR